MCSASKAPRGGILLRGIATVLTEVTTQAITLKGTVGSFPKMSVFISPWMIRVGILKEKPVVFFKTKDPDQCLSNLASPREGRVETRFPTWALTLIYYVTSYKSLSLLSLISLK